MAEPALPAQPVPRGQYVPAVVHAGLAFSAGMTPRVDGELTVRGIVGADLSADQARAAARLATENALAAVANAAGGLDRVDRCLRLTVYIACATGFGGHSAVADGASQALADWLGDRGAAARAAIGVASLPSGSPVEVELVAAISALPGAGTRFPVRGGQGSHQAIRSTAVAIRSPGVVGAAPGHAAPWPARQLRMTGRGVHADRTQRPATPGQSPCREGLWPTSRRRSRHIRFVSPPRPARSSGPGRRRCQPRCGDAGRPPRSRLSPHQAPVEGQDANVCLRPSASPGGRSPCRRSGEAGATAPDSPRVGRPKRREG